MRWIGSIFFINLIAIFTIIYGIVVTNSLITFRDVNNPAIAQNPLIFIVAVSGILLIVLILAHRFAQYTKYFLILLLGVIFLLGAILSITSGQLLPVLAFLATSIIAILLGYFISQKLKLNMESVAERLVINTSIGLGSLIMLVFVIGLIGWLQAWIIWLIFALILLITFRQLPIIWFDLRKLVHHLVNFPTSSANGYVFSIVIILISIPIFVSFLVALAPETMADAIFYQLPTPAVWAEQGQIVQIPSEHRTYYPKGINMLFALGTVLTLDETIPAHLFVWQQYLLLIGIGYAFGRVVLKNSQIGLLTAAFIATTPLIVKWTPVGYIDVGTTWASFITIYLWFKWFDQPKLGWAILTGSFAGIAIFAKPQAVQALIPLAVIALVMIAFSRQHAKTFLKQLPAFLIPALLTALPWMILVYIWTGNPIFPHLNSLFQSPYTEISNNFYPYNTFGLSRGLESLIKMPIEMTANSSIFAQSRKFNGEVSFLPLIWLMLPFSLITIQDRKLRRRSLTIVAILFGFTLIWFYSTQYLRFYMYIIPLLALVTAISIWAARSYISRSQIKILFIHLTDIVDYLVILLIGFNLLLLAGWWSTERTGLSAEYLLGTIDRETHLQNMHNNYADAFEYLNGYSDFEPVVLNYAAVGTLYYDSQLKISRADAVMKSISQIPDESYLAKLFTFVSASHLIARMDENNSLDSGTRFLPHAFVDQYLIPEYVDNRNIVFRYFDQKSPRIPTVLVNNSFEALDTSSGETIRNTGTIECSTDSSNSNCHTILNNSEVHEISLPALSDQMHELRFEASGRGNFVVTIHSLDDEGNQLDQIRYVRTAGNQLQSRSFFFIQAPTSKQVKIRFRNIADNPLMLDNIVLFEHQPNELLPNEHVAVDYNVMVERWLELNACIAQPPPASGECLVELLDQFTVNENNG